MGSTAYEDLLRDVFENGAKKGDRTGTGTRSVFGRQIRYDLSEGFPLITTKKIGLRLIVSELIWFLNGESNIRYLLEQNNHIWSEWPFKEYLIATDQSVPEVHSEEWNAQLASYEQRVIEDDAFAELYGDAGPIYGVQWRFWQDADGKVYDQINEVISQLKNNPDSRRILVSAWNVPDLPRMSLMPCHALFQFYVVDGKLSCQLYQRSADMFLGVPFNIASYALLTHMIAQQCGLEVGEFIWTGGDTHIYDNHVEQVIEQLSRDPRPLPSLVIKRKAEDIFSYTIEDFEIIGYLPHASIKGDVAV
jgi:thymidylate synthase